MSDMHQYIGSETDKSEQQASHALLHAQQLSESTCGCCMHHITMRHDKCETHLTYVSYVKRSLLFTLQTKQRSIEQAIGRTL